MNNCIFTTHATLTKEHAMYCLQSLLFGMQTENDVVWDNFIIYNTHSDEIPNEWLVDLITEYDIHDQIDNLFVFPYEDGAYKKTLTQDTINHFTILTENGLTKPGKTLLLKSDYCLSRNFNAVFKTVPSHNTIWTLPIYNAKQKVPMEEVLALLDRERFIHVDDVTYYRGGTNAPETPGTLENPWVEEGPREGVLDTSPEIRFVSHNIQNDYNLHVLSNDTLATCLQISQMALNPHSTWGGAAELFTIAFTHAGIDRYPEISAFGVHMYHGIISENRNQDRTDPRKVINGERY